MSRSPSSSLQCGDLLPASVKATCSLINLAGLAPNLMTSTARSSDAEVRDRKRMREEKGKNGQKTEESQKIKPFNFLSEDDNGQTRNGKNARAELNKRRRMRKEAEETVRKGFFRPFDKHVNHLTLTYTHTNAHTLALSLLK